MPRAKVTTTRKTRTAAKKAGSASTLSREDFLVARIVAIESDQESARSRSSWIAVLNLGRDLDKAHAELVQLRASQGDQNALDPAALLDELDRLVRDEVDGLVESDVERLYLSCCERLGLVPDGGNPGVGG